jgi:23S rRNA (uracil1939-C5)-methyltransferase
MRTSQRMAGRVEPTAARCDALPVTSSAPVDCPFAKRCPGCAWIERPPAEQLAAKRALLARALAPYGGLGPRVLPTQAAEPLAGYRTRAKLAVAPGPRLGLFARGTHEVLDLPGCPVLAPGLAAATDALRRLLAAPPAGAEAVLAPDGEGAGRLRAVDLREVEDESGPGLLLTLVLRAPAPAASALEAAGSALRAALPALRSLAVRLHDGRSPSLLGGPPRVILGPALVADRLRLGAPWLRVAPGSFVQVHRAQAARLQAAVENALGAIAGKRVLDVYAGSGALGLALAARGAKPTLVEGFAPAAEAAREAARAQGLAIEVRSAPAEQALPALRREGARFEAAVANPPRAGMTRRAREALAALVTGPLVLVSCEPRTLARDLAHLCELGLRCERLEPWDLMPLTDQVESLAVLRRASAPAAVVLHEAPAFVAVAKPPFVPTAPQAEHADSLLARVRRLRGRGEAAPLDRLELGASGVCLFATSPAHAKALAKALAAPGAERTSLALVRGVARASGRVGTLRYRRRAVVAGHALLEIRAPYGAQAPIRRQLAAIGEPVLGDERHGHAPSNRHLFERAGLDRSFLHVTGVRFVLPGAGAALAIEAPLAPDLAAVLERLGSPA